MATTCVAAVFVSETEQACYPRFAQHYFDDDICRTSYGVWRVDYVHSTHIALCIIVYRKFIMLLICYPLLLVRTVVW